MAHEDPFGQAVHSDAVARPSELEYVPARQGSCADAPRGQKLPIPQTVHAVEPDASWNSPAGHIAHSDWRVLDANVPGAHGVWAVEPTEHDDPGGQIVHSSAAVSPIISESPEARRRAPVTQSTRTLGN